jgi:hypothetical protein
MAETVPIDISQYSDERYQKALTIYQSRTDLRSNRDEIFIDDLGLKIPIKDADDLL